jgi:ubiquinone/menaquinone biosynthesis C-methylase UbiE
MANDSPSAAPSPPGLLRSILEPEFVPRSDDRYRLDDLLKYEGQEFVRNAYRAILKREPDEDGALQRLRMLLGGRFDKVDVLASLRYSAEGRQKGVSIEGLALPATARRLYRVPILGYLLELAVALLSLPASARRQRRFETYSIVQQQQLADRLRQLSERLQLVRAELTGMEKRGQSSLEDEGERLSAPSAERPSAERSSRPMVAEARHHLDAFYASFEDQFRGHREEIKERLKVYLPILREAGITKGIVDIGCGRGEWLELLKEEGARASGVDLNRVMLAECRRRGFEVTEADALDYLRGLPDESLEAVTSFHLIEHLPFETLVMLIDEIERVLKPGGLIILETPNPKNLTVGASSFYSDPTHRNPVFPETIQFILSNRGFSNAHLKYLNAVEDSPFTDEDQASQALHNWFFGARDFAVIGWKG